MANPCSILMTGKHLIKSFIFSPTFSSGKETLRISQIVGRLPLWNLYYQLSCHRMDSIYHALHLEAMEVHAPFSNFTFAGGTRHCLLRIHYVLYAWLFEYMDSIFTIYPLVNRSLWIKNKLSNHSFNFASSDERKGKIGVKTSTVPSYTWNIFSCILCRNSICSVSKYQTL